MTADDTESLDEFKNSFSYGSRSDLSFKFLKRLDTTEAAEFLRLVLLEIGELFDGAPPERLIDLAYRWQVQAYTPKPGEKRPFTYDDRPFTPLTGDLSETTLGLVTSSGHFHEEDDPVPFGGRSSLVRPRRSGDGISTHCRDPATRWAAPWARRATSTPSAG